jgi:hypothetical protein
VSPRIVVGSALALLLAACHPNPADQNWVLRSYEVPADDAMGLLVHFKDLFILAKGDGYSQIARASIAPNGRLVVVGSQEMQAGVADLVATMSTHPAPKPRTVDSNYWLVTGKPVKGESIIPPELAAVAPTLKQLAQQTGPQEFALWEELHVASGGFESEVSGRHVNVKQTAFPSLSSGDVQLDTRIIANRTTDHLLGPNEIKTKVRVASDQTVVLAQTGFNPSEPAGASSGNDSAMTLYYLVRASIPNGEPAKR